MGRLDFPFRALECEFAFQQMTVRGNFNLVEIMLNVGGMFLGGQKIFFWHGIPALRSVDFKEVPVYEQLRLERRGRC